MAERPMASVAAFLDAVRGGDRAATAAMLKSDRGLAGARDEAGLSALMLARYHGHRDVAEAILAADPPLDLHEAAIAGRADRVVAVLRSGVDVGARSVDGFTALHFAAFFADEATARVLLEHGADATAVADNASAVAPLHSAAAAGNVAVARLLLDAGADPNARQAGGFVPLHAAADNGDDALVSLLLEGGADAGARTDDGRTAADLARGKDQVSIAERLDAARTHSSP
ncbi:MAG TPA: ankyrin repeat domain-containing protein [Candidatus Limnocylindrales bacterium]|nr:ankyrin repeat domain-containing protein [Candidatus Limnocylindrales bacterium]